MLTLPVIQEKYTRKSQGAFSLGLTDSAQKLGAKFLVMFSGGKDSVAMVLHLLELGIPKSQIELHHHDVDGHGENLWDWACTPSYCRAFAGALGLDIYFSHREGGITREIQRTNEGLQDVFFQDSQGTKYKRLPSKKGSSTRHKFPAVAASLMTRWCSAVVKIDVMRRVVANSARMKEGLFVVCTGERREESPNRAKYDEWSYYACNSRNRRVFEWKPVIDWNEREIWAIIEKHRIQPHPCYMLGWSRCSCQTCIFSSPNTWASINAISPQKIDAIAEIEEKYGHTLYHKMTIIDKVVKGKSFVTSENKRRWAHEALNIFTSPIFVDSWIMPQGALSDEKAGST